jgi:hypothetical protein
VVEIGGSAFADVAFLTIKTSPGDDAGMERSRARRSEANARIAANQLRSLKEHFDRSRRPGWSLACVGRKAGLTAIAGAVETACIRRWR